MKQVEPVKSVACAHCAQLFSSAQYRDNHLRLSSCSAAQKRLDAAQKLALTDHVAARAAVKAANTHTEEEVSAQVLANLRGEIQRNVEREIRGVAKKPQQQACRPRRIKLDGCPDLGATACGSADQKRYSFEQKAAHIFQLECWCAENYVGGINARGATAAYIMMRHKKLPPKFTKYFSKADKENGWLHPESRGIIERNAADRAKARLKALPHTGAMYPDMEKELTAKWRERRKLSRKVSCRWLQVESKIIMKKKHPSINWKASRGWLDNYTKHRVIPPLVKRKVTNVKKHSLEEDLPIIQSYHHGLRKLVQTVRKRERDPNEEGICDAQTLDPKYGRFKRHKRMSGDQVPVPFIVNQNQTLEQRGVKRVHIKTPGEALAKRQYTGHVHFADRPWRMQPRAVLVCRGKGVEELRGEVLVCRMEELRQRAERFQIFPRPHLVFAAAVSSGPYTDLRLNK